MKGTAIILLFFLPGIIYGFREVEVTKEENLAISGFDTVAYFTEGKAIKGSPFYEAQWNGAAWRFSSKTNYLLFKRNPEKYAPQFGGYCSYTITKGGTVRCDPHEFMVYKGKLYVLRNKTIHEIWSRNPDKYIAIGRRNWANLLKENKKQSMLTESN